MSSFREVTITCPEQGELKLLISTPTAADPWGACGLLRGTEWEPLIQVVSGENLSHALHGWATPLARELGIAAKHRGQRISDEAGRCALIDGCLSASSRCRPGEPRLPDCYEASHVTLEASQVASRVALAWKENRLAVVIEGDEHVLT